MALHYNSWAVLAVPKGTPLECTDALLNLRCRQYHGKRARSFTREEACDEHDCGYFDNFNYSCPDCKVVTVSYTAEHLLESAIDSAERLCTRHDDGWCVDGDTLEVVACFRMTIERLV